jgi:hypothetical protein
MVSCKIQRRSATGMLSTIKGSPFAMETKRVADIDAWCQEQFGGGLYTVEVRSVDNPLQVIESIPFFGFRVEGEPKVSVLPNQHPLHPQGIREIHGPLDPTTGRAAMPTIDPRDLAAHRSDEVAMQQLQQRDRELAQERELRETDRRSAESRFEAQQRQLNEMQKQLAEAENRRERAVLEAKLEQATRVPAAPPAPPKVNWAETLPMVATALGAVTPIVVALIDSSKERSKQMVEQQTKTLDTQLNMQTQLMTKLAENKSADPLASIVALAPIAAPLIKGFMEQRSPDKLAEVMASVADNNLSQLSILKQFVEPLIPHPDENPLSAFLQQGLQSLIETAQHMVKATSQPQQPASRTLSGNGHAQTVTAGNRHGHAHGHVNGNGNGQSHQAPATDADATAHYFVQLIVAAPNVPKECKTPEWREIYHDIHTFAPAEEVARKIAAMLEQQLDAGQLPTYFQPMFAANSTQSPGEILGQLVSGLPAAGIRPDYVQDLLAIFDSLFENSPDNVAEETVEVVA